MHWVFFWLNEINPCETIQTIVFLFLNSFYPLPSDIPPLERKWNEHFV